MRKPTHLPRSYLFSYLSTYIWDHWLPTWNRMYTNSVEVHPQLSNNNRHPSSGWCAGGCWFHCGLCEGMGPVQCRVWAGRWITTPPNFAAVSVPSCVLPQAVNWKSIKHKLIEVELEFGSWFDAWSSRYVCVCVCVCVSTGSKQR